jgi:hypothetical protein
MNFLLFALQHLLFCALKDARGVVTVCKVITILWIILLARTMILARVHTSPQQQTILLSVFQATTP